MDISEVVDRFHFVPTFLDMDIANISLEVLKHIYEKTEDTGEYDGECVNTNLLSFFSIIFQKQQKASEFNSTALEIRPRNIQANVIKVILLFLRGEISEAERSLEHVKLLSEDDYLISESKAEIAYAYSRIDVNLYLKAIILYEEIVKKYPDNFMWKYRLALTIRRKLHPSLVQSWSLQDQWDKYNQAKTLFEDIVARCCLPEIKSLSYIGLATLTSGSSARKEFVLRRGLHGNQAVMATMEYLDKANEVCDDNEKILTETGRMLRSIKEYEAAIKILERAYGIKSTTINCHHLGLALQKIDNKLSSSIEYLEKAVVLSDGLNTSAVFDLGKAYLLNNMLDKACECFEALIDSTNYQTRQQGFEYLSKYYQVMQRKSISGQQRMEYGNKQRKCQRESIINAVMEYLKWTPINKREKLSPIKLFNTKNAHQYDYSKHGRALYMVYYYKQSLRHHGVIQRILRSSDIDKEMGDLVMCLFRDKMYEDCLDMLTIMMMTSIKDVEKFAVDISLDIVEKIADNINVGEQSGAMDRNAEESLLKTCFKWMKDCLLSDELDSDIRLIYKEGMCQQELDTIEELLLSIGMRVKKNDQGILPFTNRMKSLSSLLSSTIAVVCILEENNIDLLNNYPIDNLSHDRPTILYMAINHSNIPPILQTRQSMSFPDFSINQDSKGKWLKEFGQKIFYSVLNN